MKNNSLYSFFIFLALTFWNPLTFYFVYRHNPVGHSHILMAIFGLIAIAGIVAIYRINKDKIKQKNRDSIFLVSFFGILFAAVVGINLLFSLKNKPAKADTAKKQGLIFEPNSRVRYQTPEYDYTAYINSLGLRDNEISIEKTKTRILCFGDSHTFGWGVTANNSWPKKLDSFLNAGGANVEVINCGQPGGYTSIYKQYVAKAVPLLKPDYVLVGVLQLDDLAQLYENNYDVHRTNTGKKDSRLSGVVNTFQQFLLASVDNFKPKHSDSINIKENWQKSTNEYIGRMTDYQYLRYMTFDDSERKLFESGNLNAGLLSYYFSFPDRSYTFNDPANACTQFAINEMVKDFAEMKKVCDDNHATLIFVNLPEDVFTGHKVVRMPSQDIINEHLVQNNHIDSMYAYVAAKTGVPYFEMTKHFKELTDKTSYYFRYDGHPCAKGYEETADEIYKYLIANYKLNK